ncbi:unnamed protein product [Vitrella brassicaformis CCMP3155]|uniref:RNA helicase n=4 Tax=Vitrella brassicaformis TaxID=1169539 RepID=A0A0G4GSG8_VITBC|nr:unnamed protein product [Vitrella brassicaformis CCMP3155]|eukprot:CEM33558.1 unnamed protein product [Vitrella brassicaformis CCMP3155]
MSLEAYIGSRLHDLLGFSSQSVVQLFADCSRNASSLQHLKQDLISAGVDRPVVDAIASDFYTRLHEPPPPPKRPASAAAAASDQDDLESAAKRPRVGDKANGDASPSQPPPDDPPLDAEAARLRDIEERDALARRIRDRDDEKTKKLGQQVHEMSTELRDASLREDPDAMDRLREVARRQYLKKREDRQIELAERELADREWMYQGVKITDKEKRDLELQRQTLEAAKRLRDERANRGQTDDYVIPEAYDEDQDKRMGVLSTRYQEEKRPETEQEIWERQQTSAAVAHFGAKRGKDSRQKKYDLVVDSIDFVSFDGDIASELKREEEQDEEEAALSIKERKARSLQEDRQSLPVYRYRDELLRAIRDNTVLVVVGETGSGKTTQIPQYLYEVGYGKSGMIGCTQPRRVAAMSVAARVAQEMGVKLGHEVGYSIRFEDCTTDKTIIKYMTDGMLLRELLGEPDLKSYSVMLVDEAHERTLHTDVLFGIVKDLARYRDDFKLIISSATLDAEKFSEYFDEAPIYRIPGRRYHVQAYYTKAPEANYVEACVVTVLQIHTTQPLGDILVFFPGQQEIEEAMEALQVRTRGAGSAIGELIILPIYANLPSDLQAKIFEPTPPGARKVVLATNIAETSITIDNIVYVIDPGYCKQNTYNPKTGMESLVVVPISKASANQRMGRAGRVKPGKAFRLYTKWSYEKELDDNNVPEIQRTNLGNVVLMLKSLGIDDLLHFDFMDPPPPETLIKALELLYALGALNDKGELTKLGRRMAEFPLDPMYSKMVIQSEKYKVVDEVVTICAMLGVGAAIFYRPKDKAIHADNARKNFFRQGGDHPTLLNVYKQWEDTNFSIQWCFENFVQHRSMKRARDIREQLLELLERVEIEPLSSPNELDGMRKAITSGFFTQAARLNKSGSYATLKHPHTVEMHPQSSLFGCQPAPKCVVYTELVLTTKEYMRNVIEIKPEWLREVAPHYYKASEVDFAAKMPKVPKGSAMGAASSAI